MKNHPFTHFTALLIFLLSSSLLSAQGSWNPPGADLSHPRTLLKTQEIPAAQAYLSHPVIYPLYQSLWNQVQTFTPGNMTVDGHRRNAAHAAKNCAFILLLDRKPVGGNLDTLTVAEADFLRSKSISLLNMINTFVEAYPNIDKYLWRSNEITDNAIAYDLLKGAGVPQDSLNTARDLIQEFAGNLHEEVEFDLFNLGFFSLHVDNHALRTSGALGLAAIALNDAQSTDAHDQPQSWINAAMYNIDNVLWRDADAQSAPGVIGGYSEGSHYVRFGMKHVLPFVHAMGNFLPDTSLSYSFDGNTRSIANPWYSEDFRNIFRWIMKVRMPDGTMPALEDANVMVAFPEATILEDPALAFPTTYTWFHPDQPNTLWRQLHYSSDDITADYIASMTQPAPQPDSLFLALPESGNMVMRSGWDSLALYLHFSAKNGRAREAGKGHNQADASSFILHAYGQLLALDPGYLKWDRRDEVSNAQNHSMILVDSLGPVNGSTLAGGDADAFVENTIDLRDLDYGEIRTAYEGANIVRKPLFVRKSYYLLGDFVSSSQPHTYTFQLHGYGLEAGDSIHGNYTHLPSQNRGMWTRNGVTLLAQATATGGLDQFTRQTNIHELRYDSMQEHTTLLADKIGNDAAFLTALMPFVNDTPQVQTLCATDCGALMVETSGYTDVAFTSGLVQANATGLSGDLVSDAGMAFYSEDSTGGFAQLLCEEGTVMTLGADSLCFSSVSMDLAFSKLDAMNYEGWASAPATVRLFDLNFVPGSVLGVGVNSWSYNANDNVLSIVFGQGGRFTVHEAVIIGLPGAAPQEDLLIWPNPASGRVHLRTVSGGELCIYDVRGRLMRKISVAEGHSEVDLDGLSQGLYLAVLLRDGKKVAARKIMLE